MLAGGGFLRFVLLPSLPTVAAHPRTLIARSILVHVALLAGFFEIIRVAFWLIVLFETLNQKYITKGHSDNDSLRVRTLILL